MKIYKVAQSGGDGGGIEAGFVRIQFDAGEQDQRTEILGHGPGTSCGSQNDSLLLEDLLNIEIGGFGSTDIGEGGLTAEGYRAKQKSRPTTVNPSKTKKNKAPFGGPFGTQQEDERRKVDLDFGV